MKKPKNTIRTPSYFCKRLRDNGFIVLKIFNGYGPHDPRRWTVLVDPGGSSIFITCFTNRVFGGDVMFELSDGGQTFPKNYNIKTESIEVIISYLIKSGVSNTAKTSPYYSSPKYICDEKQQEESRHG